MIAGDPIADWPDALVDALRARRGRSLAAARLSGMSGADVWRVRGELGGAVVKRAADPREHRFYTAVASDLRARGVAIPDLLAAHAETGAYWLALEELPTALPRARWLADPDVLGNLARLHATPWSALTGAGSPSAWYRCRRTAEITRVVAAVATPRGATPLAELLERAARVLAGGGVISGDPNPRNWGLRPDGSAALFDWERFGTGSPAFDLAITVPGLGAPGDFARVAAAYAALAAPGAAAPSAADIALAKVWNVVEFLSLEYTHPAIDRASLAALRAALPGWLEQVAVFAR